MCEEGLARCKKTHILYNGGICQFGFFPAEGKPLMDVKTPLKMSDEEKREDTKGTHLEVSFVPLF